MKQISWINLFDRVVLAVVEPHAYKAIQASIKKKKNNRHFQVSIGFIQLTIFQRHWESYMVPTWLTEWDYWHSNNS